jgi:hypothetical protein
LHSYAYRDWSCTTRLHPHAQPAPRRGALNVDPHRHPELDGSGTVRDIPIKGPHHLAAGDKFTVGMKQWGVPYKITSTLERLAARFGG